MVPLDLLCCIFHENESEEFQHLLEMVDVFSKPESDKLLPKFNAEEYNEFKMYLKRIKILNKEVVSHNEFYKMCMKELHQKHNDNETLKKKMDEMRFREADVVKRIGDLEIKNSTLGENLPHVHAKINAMQKHMNTLTLDDWKADRKWKEYMIMVESYASCFITNEGRKGKKVVCTRDGKRGAEW